MRALVEISANVPEAGLSAAIAMFGGDGFGGEPFACIVVDAQAAQHAPAGELVRVEHDALGDCTTRLPLAAQLLGALVPLVPGPRQRGGIGEEGEQAGVVLAPVPRNADGAHLHANSPAGCVAPPSIGTAGAGVKPAPARRRTAHPDEAA